MLLDRCCLCRRVRGTKVADSPESRWSDLRSLLDHEPLTAPEIVFTEVTCPDCDSIYRLLLTYGSAPKIDDPLTA